MKFKGIDIAGDLSLMVERLQKEGFTLVTQENIFAVMEGEFANKQCKLFVVATPSTYEVYEVIVNFEKTNSWSSLKSDYLEFKNLLKGKYNTEPKSIEKFVRPYYEGDGYELTALSVNKCDYASVFDLDNGSIMVGISPEKSVNVVYEDKIGSFINEQEEKEISINDL
ncbi:MAG: hypothetical protein IKU78_01795 [Paludibacteraceae bacterium]|nr:hypothetical protein [Paludibacteraceae bacterium]